MRRTLIGPALFLAATALALGQAAQTPVPVTAPTTVATGSAAATPAPDAVQVPVKRIVLFSSGVGFFEHSGIVNGNASTELMFKTEQINDILKSLLLSDRAGGQIRSVTYPSLDPLSRTLKSFQIDISGNPPLADLLNQIRGAKVLVALGDEQLVGTVLGVQRVQRPVGNPEKLEELWQLNLLTDTGIRTAMLQDAKRIDIQDPTLQKELQQALEALAQVRDKDKKSVIIHFEGQGDRPVSIGYVVETPIWKTSYRLLLPDPGVAGPARLQGWAIVENQTENDWTGVDLTLIGGRPISFIENLYQPLYIPRPLMNPKTYASLQPQTYAEGIESPTERLAAQAIGSPQMPGGAAAGRGGRGGRGGGGGGGGGGLAGGGAATFAASAASSSLAADMSESARAAAAPDYSQGVASIAAAAKVGELFQYQIGNVSLPRQRSAMLPIVSDDVEFDRLSIYNASVLPRNPLLGVRLKNGTGKYLLGGPLTVMHTVPQKGAVYAGDAQVDDVPIGAERLLSYGVDQETLVDSTKASQNEHLVTGSIVKGVLELKYLAESTHDYVIDNKSGHEKTVIIEDPVNLPFELVEPAKPLEKTDTLYRFQTVVAAGKTGTFTVKKRSTRGESIALLPMDVDVFQIYVGNGAIPESVKKALATVVQKKQSLTDLQRQLEQKEKDRTRVLEEENNIRSNITVLPAGTQTRDDQIKSLTDHESDLARINADIQSLQARHDAARDELEKSLGDMSVE